jgi:hypothetical protein
MIMVIIAVILLISAIFIPFLLPKTLPQKAIAAATLLGAMFCGVFGSISYNDAGSCAHIRTIFGSESSKCDVGWYFQGWGTTTSWPHYIGVQNTIAGAPTQVSDSLAQYGAYSVRLADNWTGDITQTTRFGIPQSEPEFLRLAHDFRTPERLITSMLVPAVNAALDTTANLFTMEEYYAGGSRDAFKKEYQDTIILGPAITEKIDDPQIIQKKVSANPANPVTADTNEVAAENEVKIVEKKVDKTGNDIRPIKNQYSAYGIVVNSAIIQNLDPDGRYEEQIKLRKEAISRRVIARDQRLEQEEQRLLTIAKSETEISARQGQARVAQIERTTDAETTKKLALIEAGRQLEQADVDRKTATIALDTAKINADAQIVKAQADAKSRELAIQADNALQSKLNAEVEIQRVWAEAYAKRAVPQIVMGGASDGGAPVGSDTEITKFFNLLNANAAKNLAYDRKLDAPAAAQ